MTGTAKNPFWQYSLQLYARDGVEALCLRLQEQCGVNVNILLWACWLAQQGRPLSDAHLQHAITLIAPYQCDYIEPLRKMRNVLKSSMQQALREKILAAELEAEKSVQDELYQYYQGERWARDGTYASCRSENIQRVLVFYKAAAEVPQAIDVLS